MVQAGKVVAQDLRYSCHRQSREVEVLQQQMPSDIMRVETVAGRRVAVAMVVGHRVAVEMVAEHRVAVAGVAGPRVAAMAEVEHRAVEAASKGDGKCARRNASAKRGMIGEKITVTTAVVLVAVPIVGLCQHWRRVDVGVKQYRRAVKKSARCGKVQHRVRSPVCSVPRNCMVVT